MTLVELAVASLIVLIILGGVVQGQRALNDAREQQQLSLRAQQEARLGIDAMSEELRLATPIRLNPTGLGVGNLGDIDQPTLLFQTVTWDPATESRVYSSWIQYQLNPADPTILERVQYVEGGVTVPPVLTTANTRQLARNVFREVDLNGNGVLDIGEDINGDGRWQRGLWFSVRQEDQNDDDLLGSIEDVDADGLLDARVLVTVDTRVLPTGPAGRQAVTSVATAVELRNAAVPGL